MLCVRAFALNVDPAIGACSHTTIIVCLRLNGYIATICGYRLEGSPHKRPCESTAAGQHYNTPTMPQKATRQAHRPHDVHAKSVIRVKTCQCGVWHRAGGAGVLPLG